MALTRALFAAAVAFATCPAMAQPAPARKPATPAAAARPEPTGGGDTSAGDASVGDASVGDTWIFSGVLADTSETFSGTLITGKSATEFELKLADGATCDGGDLKPSMGLVRLSEIACSDGRSMRALFVPQAHESLKVFGHVGEARFSTIAHLLGTQPIPEPPQTTAPHAPEPPPAEPAPPPSRPGAQDPG